VGAPGAVFLYILESTEKDLDAELSHSRHSNAAAPQPLFFLPSSSTPMLIKKLRSLFDRLLKYSMKKNQTKKPSKKKEKEKRKVAPGIRTSHRNVLLSASASPPLCWSWG
jgi:hypothetical protein